MKATLGIFLLLSLISCLLSEAIAAPSIDRPQLSNAQLDAAAAQAKQRVIEIVNQPIAHLPRTEEAAVFSPGWFHPGAVRPDFSKVDIRATQELTYAGDRYVTSDLNPTEMFVGNDLEFNAMTKYFYVDRTLPKARLSEGEMIEINNLYRIIGRDEEAETGLWRHIMFLMTWVGVGIALVAGFLLIRQRMRA